MAADLLLQAMQFAATVHLEPRNRGTFMSANPNLLVEDGRVMNVSPVMMEMAGVVVFIEEPEDNGLKVEEIGSPKVQCVVAKEQKDNGVTVEDLQVERPVMMIVGCPVTDCGWKAIDSSWKCQPSGLPLQAPTCRQRIVVVAVWQDRVVVLQRGDVITIPGATIED